MQKLKETESDGWTPWKWDVVESDEVGAEHPGGDDRPEADFEAKKGEEEETKGLDAMEPTVVEVPRNEESQQKIIDDPAEEALEEPIREEAQIRCQEPVPRVTEQDVEMERSAW